MRLFRPAIWAVAAVSAGPAFAHHALETMYDTSTDVEALATLSKVDWINPHAWMRFHIQYPKGTVVQNVPIETLGLGSLRQQGIGRDTLEVGTQYKITFYPTRNGQPGGFMFKLVQPNGTMVGAPAYDPSGDGEPEVNPEWNDPTATP